MVDARDLGAWCVEAGRAGVTGPFVATGPCGQSTYGELFAAARAATGSDAEFTWVADEFLVEQKVHAWVELPLWIPAAEAPAIWDQDTGPIEDAGLRCRPVPETVADTAAWIDGLGGSAAPRRTDRPAPGLAPEREAELLAAWHARAEAG
jgi:hypothetical protein